jgi:hypothetical protein
VARICVPRSMARVPFQTPVVILPLTSGGGGGGPELSAQFRLRLGHSDLWTRLDSGPPFPFYRGGGGGGGSEWATLCGSPETSKGSAP